MTIQQLRYVSVISDSGSLNKASEQLYISQPSLTSSLQELEKEIGITIFSRSGRGVTPTNDGIEFIRHAREIISLYDSVLEKYGKNGKIKKKFGISSQHYSFAVKSFIEMVKHFGTDEYEFAIRETRTRDVIDDVFTGKSEIGILYLDNFNRKPLEKLFKSNGLVFNPLTRCQAFVYMWKDHPLADKEYITFDDLTPYPCLSFEQGGNASFYYSEEILSTNEYKRMIKANDRATMLNLMIGLNGYTLCSGVISEEINGCDYIAVPFSDNDTGKSNMEIGYICRKNAVLSAIAKMYILELDSYLKIYKENHKIS